MQPRQRSLTARGAASHRAAHQTLEGGRIFTDPYACAILGETAEAVAQAETAQPQRRPMRLFVAARSRFTEEHLAGAVARGTRQAVILGAGLDTFALRNPFAAQGLRVFEVDHPATQAWKRERLAETKLVAPSLTFAPMDFERDDLAAALGKAGFDAARPSFFFWLGVTPYLTKTAITATLRAVAAMKRSEIVFDYAQPLESYPPGRRAWIEQAAKRVAEMGEPWLSFYEPEALHAELHALGFDELEDIGPRELAVRYFEVPEDKAIGGNGGHVIRARKAA